MNQIKILLVEDEDSLREVIALNLKMEGYEVHTIANGMEAYEHRHEVAGYDLVVLDVMLPEMSGWSLCEAYKKEADTPILFMSAKGSSSDKVKGLRLGADDYLGKPFDLEELLLRVQILLQRSGKLKEKTEVVNIGESEVNMLTYEVLKEEKVITELSKREIELLQLFFQHEGEVVSRDFILNQLWGKDTNTTSRTIDNYILSYRKLFEKDPKNPKYFHSIRGVGYKFTND